MPLFDNVFWLTLCPHCCPITCQSHSYIELKVKSKLSVFVVRSLVSPFAVLLAYLRADVVAFRSRRDCGHRTQARKRVVYDIALLRA